MSTIFNTSYSDSLRRIQGEKRETRQEQGIKKPLTFAEVLSQTEEKPKLDGDARAALGIQGEGLRAEPMISNLTSIESERIEAPSYRLSTHELNISPSQKPDVGVTLPAPVQNPVKIPANPAPKAVLPKAENFAVPKAPTMFAAKRVETPLLISALEEEVKNLEIPTPRISKTEGEDALEAIITKAGKHHGVDPALSIAVARAESSLRIDAISKDGHASKGMFQLLDGTGKELMNRLDVDGQYAPFDPAQNAHLGVGYLRRLHDLFSKESNLGFNLRTNPANSASDLEKTAVAAFNAGEGNVAKAQQMAKSLGKDPGSYDAIQPHLPASTRAYVERVTALKARNLELTEEETLA